MNVDTISFVVEQIYMAMITMNKNWKISSLSNNEIEKSKGKFLDVMEIITNKIN